MTEKIEITFLGTSSAPPQKERRQSSIALKYKGMTYLIDIGEGTQIQMIKNQIGFKNTTILLTHLHSDHCLGLFGYLATRNFFDIKNPITIIGPPWTTTFLFLQFLAFRFYPEYDIKVIETNGGIVYSDKYLSIHSFRVNHSIESFGYKFITHQRLGRFNFTKAEKLKIPKGKLWKQLQKGIPISLNGKKIFPSDVLDEIVERGANEERRLLYLEIQQLIKM
ncbi:MAG: MBL fold metallo-hydrolase [Candidatus Heimdallarchaeaceae archaeon]